MIIDYSVAKNNRLKVPYTNGNGSGNSGIGFVNLKIEPERISEMHELKGYPELEAVILSLNQKNSIFRTLRTDTAKNYFKLPGFPYSEFSHLTICFERPNAEGDPANYQHIHNLFIDHTSGLELSDYIFIDFVLVPLELTISNFQGWCLDIWLYGYGKSYQEARKNWFTGLQILGDFLLMVDEENR